MQKEISDAEANNTFCRIFQSRTKTKLFYRDFDMLARELDNPQSREKISSSKIYKAKAKKKEVFCFRKINP